MSEILRMIRATRVASILDMAYSSFSICILDKHQYVFWDVLYTLDRGCIFCWRLSFLDNVRCQLSFYSKSFIEAIKDVFPGVRCHWLLVSCFL